MPTIRKSLQHKTMSMAAAEMIREKILAGKFSPGFQLKQDILAMECGTSRIPIREALVQLESEGLVKILPHKGAIVVELSTREIEELFNMRTLLEPFLFERSAPLLTEADFQELEKILTRYTTAIDRHESANWNELNTLFHMHFYRHAGSPRISATVHNLLQECDRHTRFQLSNIEGDPQRAVSEHAELLRLSRERKFKEGSTLLWKHIDHVRVVLVKILQQHQEETAGQSAA